MNELLQAFSLGNAAILTNACLLPLYPGLIAFLAGNVDDKRSRRGAVLMGTLVLVGILTMMVFIGGALYLLQSTFGDVLGWLLPAIYALVILFGLMMLSGNNLFAHLSTAQAPVLQNRYATAYVYGLFFGPMTLPCTGPIITTAFLLGTSEGGSLAGELLYFVFFGLGFGWPLLLLPLAALPLQRRIVGWLSRNHDVLTRASGVLLIAVGVFGIITELLPQYVDFTLEQSGQFLYWGAAILLTVIVGWWTYRSIHSEKAKIEAQPEAVGS